MGNHPGYWSSPEQRDLDARAGRLRRSESQSREENARRKQSQFVAIISSTLVILTSCVVVGFLIVSRFGIYFFAVISIILLAWTLREARIRYHIFRMRRKISRQDRWDIAYGVDYYNLPYWIQEAHTTACHSTTVKMLCKLLAFLIYRRVDCKLPQGISDEEFAKFFCHLYPIRRSVGFLQVWSPKITDLSIVKIATLSGLRRLDFSASTVTNVVIPHLKQLARLEDLNIYGSQIDNNGLDELRQFVKDHSKDS